MPGIVTFPTLAAAIRAGFEVYDRTDEGYLMRTRTTNGWAFALVVLRNVSAPSSQAAV